MNHKQLNHIVTAFWQMQAIKRYVNKIVNVCGIYVSRLYVHKTHRYESV